MSLIPCNQNTLISSAIPSILSIIDNTINVIDNRSMQREAFKIMRDKQIAMLKTELAKLEAQLKIHAIGDLYRVALEEIKRTMAQFEAACKETPALVKISAQLLKMQVVSLAGVLDLFARNECGGTLPLLR